MRNLARRLGLLLPLCLVLAAAFAGPAPAAAEAPSYSIKEARAYAYQASLSKEAIEAAPKCNPEQDKYKCDEGRWNHKPNCPTKIEIGPRGKVPQPKPPEQVEPTSGGAGDGAGGDKPPKSSPVRYNRIISLAATSRLGPVKEVGGYASEAYVDLSGRDEGEAHTQTDAFAGNARAWEERCWPEDNAKEDRNDYTHLLSRSSKTLATYHMSQCLRRACTFQAPSPGSFGASAERALSIVDVKEIGGKVVGKLAAVVEDLQYGGGQLTVESLETYVTFSSDGTPQGLKWSVSTRAQGAKLGPQPISLPPGRVISVPGASVGLAAPHVEASPDGTTLNILAAGLMFASEQQTAYFAGIEVAASFGDIGGLDFGHLPTTTTTTTGGATTGTTGVGGTGGAFGGIGGGSATVGGTDLGGFGGGTADAPGEPVAVGPGGELLVYEQLTGRGITAAIIGLGAICWFLLMSRWLQRFSWGRKLLRMQPFKGIDWLYRAFVKT